jgi:hypothetical protein
VVLAHHDATRWSTSASNQFCGVGSHAGSLQGREGEDDDEGRADVEVENVDVGVVVELAG